MKDSEINSKWRCNNTYIYASEYATTVLPYHIDISYMPDTMSCSEWHDRDEVESASIEIDHMEIRIHACGAKKGVFFLLRKCIEWMAMRVTLPIPYLDEDSLILARRVSCDNIDLSSMNRIIRRLDGTSLRLEILEGDDFPRISGFSSRNRNHKRSIKNLPIIFYSQGDNYSIYALWSKLTRLKLACLGLFDDLSSTGMTLSEEFLLLRIARNIFS